MTTLKLEPSADPPESGATARLRLDHPLFGQRVFMVTFEVCPNPACHCAGVTFNCTSVGPPSGPAATEPIEFSVDVQCRAMLGEDGSPASGALGESVAAGLDETGWNWLLGFFVNTKRVQMETVDLDQVDFVLPADLRAGQTTMLAYNEVFPWADSILLTLGPDRWLIDDQFCVRPGCTCTDAVLLFLRLPKTDDRPPRKQQKSSAALRFDYLRGAATEILKATRTAPSPAKLIEAAVAAHGTLADTFRRRHQQLKYLYERHPQRYPDPAASPGASGAGIKVQPEPSPGAATAPARLASRPKVGRNAPCPCRSGRKYKKCCGASLR